MSAMLSDGELVVKLQSGDLGVLGILYERYKMIVYRTALAITRDPSTAEDILQDCFLRVYERAHLIDSSRPLKPWLYRVTVNMAYNRERRGKRWQTSLDGIIDRLTSPIHHSPEWQAEMSDVYSKVIRAISSLNINQRSVITLFYLNSLSVKEIATILECPVGTVKSRLYHGRENLRQEMARKAPFEMAYGAV
ncbi:MAG: RNA polymerase sigma factor [Chloroflexi bacterium]|nr:RNA polymerase sigma factor [Chloroflexota bacterium]